MSRRACPLGYSLYRVGTLTKGRSVSSKRNDHLQELWARQESLKHNDTRYGTRSFLNRAVDTEVLGTTNEGGCIQKIQTRWMRRSHNKACCISHPQLAKTMDSPIHMLPTTTLALRFSLSYSVLTSQSQSDNLLHEWETSNSYRIDNLFDRYCNSVGWKHVLLGPC